MARIGELVAATGSRLLEIPGCGVLTAGRILGQTGDVRRFRDRRVGRRNVALTGIADRARESASAHAADRSLRKPIPRP